MADEPTVTSKLVNREEEEDVDSAAAADEDTGAQVAPIVKLQEVAVTTGEENEEALFERKAKLYRFDNGQWKERGVGVVKLLKHKETGIVRIVMRQAKTLKICANHRVFPTISLQEHAGNEKSCVWHATDFADGELKDETFAMRFPSLEDCNAFKEKVKEVAESLESKGDDSEDAEAATLINKLNVAGDNDKDEKKPEGEKEPEKASVDAKSESPADDK